MEMFSDVNSSVLQKKFLNNNKAKKREEKVFSSCSRAMPDLR